MNPKSSETSEAEIISVRLKKCPEIPMEAGRKTVDADTLSNAFMKFKFLDKLYIFSETIWIHQNYEGNGVKN